MFRFILWILAAFLLMESIVFSMSANLTAGLIMTDWMNELDFTAMTLGNHEYDWGEEYIESNDKYIWW